MGRRSAVGTMSRAEGGGGWGCTDLYHRRRTSGPAWALAARRARRICAFEYGPQKTKKTKTHSRDDDIDRLHCTTLHYGSTHTQYTHVTLSGEIACPVTRLDLIHVPPPPVPVPAHCLVQCPDMVRGLVFFLFLFVGALANSQQVWQTLHVYFFTLVSWSVKIKYIFCIPIPISIPRR